MLRKMDVELVRQQPILEYAESRLKLRKVGMTYFALCPFHKEKTPSFSINVRGNYYKCHGCGVYGSIVDLCMELEGLSFPHAVKYLAKFFGLKVKEVLQQEDVLIDQNAPSVEKIVITHNQTQKLFTENFFNNRPAREYLYRRGYCSKEEVVKWGVGLCPSTLSIEKESLEEAGMLSNNGNLLFSNRLTFPIHDEIGNIVGYTARNIDKKNTNLSKYVNTRETLAYVKHKVLYNFHRAKKAIQANNQFILVEGPTDVHALERVSVFSAVCPLGTSLTIEQIETLSKRSKFGFLMKDGDNAGVKSALRDIGNFWANEMDVDVVECEKGKDPCDMVREYGAEWIKNCQSYPSQRYAYEKRLELNGGDMDQAIKDALKDVARCPNLVKRETHLKKLSHYSGYSIKALFQDLKKVLLEDFRKKRLQ